METMDPAGQASREAALIAALATAGYRKDDGSAAKALIEAAPAGFDFGPAMKAVAERPRQRNDELILMAAKADQENPVAKGAIMTAIRGAIGRGDEESYQALMAVAGYPKLPPSAADATVERNDQRMVLAVLPFVDDKAPGASKSIVAAIDRFGLDAGGAADLADFGKQNASFFDDPVIKQAILGYDGVARKAAAIEGDLAKIGDKLAQRHGAEPSLGASGPKMKA